MNYDKGRSLADQYRYWEPGQAEPLCLCGCGLPVSFARKNYPRNYRRGHHPNLTTAAARDKRIEGLVDINLFREALLSVKEEKGWTIAEISKVLGFSRSHLSSLLYNKDRHLITQKLLDHTLARLAGEDTPPTSWEIRQMREQDVNIPAEKFRQALRKLSVDKGRTLRNFRQVSGISDAKWRNIMYEKSISTVPPDLVRHILARIAGIATPATPLEQKKPLHQMRWEGEVRKIAG